MTYTPHLNLGTDWIEVIFRHSQEESGKYGACYRVYVEHNGVTKHFYITPNQYNLGRPYPWYKIENGKKILVKKTKDSYPETKWNYTTEEIHKKALANGRP